MNDTTNSDSDEQTEQHDGYNVIEELSPREWLEYDTEGWEEYVHVVADKENRELRCYRTANDGFPNERIKTTIENVKMRFTYDDDILRLGRDHDGKVLRGWFLTWRQADTFLSFVDLVERSRDESKLIKLQWYENNSKRALEGTGIKDETISFSFKTESGQERHIQIQDSWKAPSNQMAKYEDNN
jgi:hypothetical protein